MEEFCSYVFNLGVLDVIKITLKLLTQGNFFKKKKIFEGSLLSSMTETVPKK